MKKIYVVAVLMFGLVSAGVFAGDQSPTKASETQEKPIVVRITNVKSGGADFTISPEDFPNGVFISTRVKFVFRDPVRYEKVEEMIAKKMQGYGFKIAKNPEEASGTLFFHGHKFAEIDKGETDKLSEDLALLITS